MKYCIFNGRSNFFLCQYYFLLTLDYGCFQLFKLIDFILVYITSKNEEI